MKNIEQLEAKMENSPAYKVMEVIGGSALMDFICESHLSGVVEMRENIVTNFWMFTSEAWATEAYQDLDTMPDDKLKFLRMLGLISLCVHGKRTLPICDVMKMQKILFELYVERFFDLEEAMNWGIQRGHQAGLILKSVAVLLNQKIKEVDSALRRSEQALGN